MIKRVTTLNCGKARSGKDKSKDLLMELLPKEFDFKHLSFARKVKEHAAIVLSDLFKKPITVEDLDNPENKEFYRPYVITIGEGGRLIDPEIWVKFTKDLARESNSIFTDCRYENELYGIKEIQSDTHLVIAVRFKASDEKRIERGANPALFHVKAEVGLDHIPDSEFDFVIDNEGDDIEELKTKLNPIAQQIKDHIWSEPQMALNDFIDEAIRYQG